ncbi:hypothetical protein DJ52_09845 [Brachyspira murdochii]|uniref:Uncharacterized protein n=1 Tax=Brachyspira murdochii TaxID=84378 RepID=A0ABX5B2W1_9SPIR|nr:hypothetical protein DJ52_09845 [Brachyspira murdochii]
MEYVNNIIVFIEVKNYNKKYLELETEEEKIISFQNLRIKNKKMDILILMIVYKKQEIHL